MSSMDPLRPLGAGLNLMFLKRQIAAFSIIYGVRIAGLLLILHDFYALH